MPQSLTIIGLGNEMLSDDGLGIRALRELKRRLHGQDIVFEELSLGGLPLLDYLIGYDRCIIIDAITTGLHPPGTAYRFLQTGQCTPVTIRSSHQIDLSQILGLAQLIGARVPGELFVYGIEASDVLTFHDGCTSAVTEAIPSLVNAVCHDLDDDQLLERIPAGQWQIIECGVPDRFTMEHI